MKPDRFVKALDGVSFELAKNETLAIVGESGCGKSTLAKALMQLEIPTAGEISLGGQVLPQQVAPEFRQKVQMIFQDPYASLNPRKKVRDLIAEPLVINTNLSAQEREEKVLSMMEKVGLRPELADRYPHMFSGGQRQRVGIARALILQPELIICDEPVSALDISIQAQVLNQLVELQDEMNLSYIFISHDLSVVRHIAHRVMVMYLGKVVEIGTREQIFENPQHPYTKALLDSTPGLRTLAGGERPKTLQGELPSPLNPPAGCSFHKRCYATKDHCKNSAPVLENKQGRSVACFEARD